METPLETPPETATAENEQPESADVSKEPRTPTDSPVLRSTTPNGQSCPVCLGPIDNVSFTDTCAHEFCFACLVQWSRVKPECPLCKRRFQVIMYNVKSAIDFSRLPVTEIEPERQEPEYPYPDLRAFRFHSTLATSSDFFRRNQNREVAAIRRRLQQMIDEMRQRSLEHMRLRLYRNRLKTVVPSNGRIREASPSFFRRYPASIHRLLPFLNRELRVLFEGNNSDVSRMLNLVTSLLPRYLIMSEEFIDAVRPFLGSRAKRFCQELMTFAKCPYDLNGYDRNAHYEQDAPPIDVDAEPDPPNIAALISSPEFNPNLGVRTSLDFGVSAPGPSTSSSARMPSTASAAAYTIEISSDSSSSSDESSDDDSWVDVSTIQQSGVVDVVQNEPHQAPIQQDIVHDESSSDGSDCLIVGFDKPWEQRSPVMLTSESEHEDLDAAGYSQRSRLSVERKHRIAEGSLDLRKRRHSESSSGDEFPSPSVLAARGKRWSPGLLLAAGSSRPSFFPTLLSSTSSEQKTSPSEAPLSDAATSASVSPSTKGSDREGSDERKRKHHRHHHRHSTHRQ